MGERRRKIFSRFQLAFINFIKSEYKRKKNSGSKSEPVAAARNSYKEESHECGLLSIAAEEIICVGDHIHRRVGQTFSKNFGTFKFNF